MKVVVVGGSGLIGSKVSRRLADAGHSVVAASPSTGVNTLTGDGLDAALAGADAVLDVSNSPSFADADVMQFFETSTGNLLAAEARAGVGHHVALSIVGADRLPDSGYMRAKVRQEALISDGPVPWTIVRATQFFEFLTGIADGAMRDGTIHLTSAYVQPMAADDVAAALAEVVLAPPQRTRIEIAGPERYPLDEIVAAYLRAKSDPRTVTTDRAALYFGGKLDDSTLTPGPGPRLGATRFARWLEQH